MTTKRLVGAIKRAQYPNDLGQWTIREVLQAIASLAKAPIENWSHGQVLINLIDNDSRFDVMSIEYQSKIVKHKVGTPFEREIIIPNLKGVMIANNGSNTVWFIGFINSKPTIRKIG